MKQQQPQLQPQQAQPKVQQPPQTVAQSIYSPPPQQQQQQPIPRNPVQQPINQTITRRPSVTYTGEIVRGPAPPPPLQRIDSRTAISQPIQQSTQPQQYQTIQQQNRPIQQQQPSSGQQQQPRLVQQHSQQQFQQKQPLHQSQPIHQPQTPLQTQNHQQPVTYQQRPSGPQYQQSRPELVTRRPSIQQVQAPLISQQQQQPLPQNRPLVPTNQQAHPIQVQKQLSQQSFQQNRPPPPVSLQHLNSAQNLQIRPAPPQPQGYSRSPTPQGQAPTQQQQLNQLHSGSSDVNRTNPGVYRVQNPYQQAQPIRPGNPTISNNLARLQEERRKMSAEINTIPENKQPSYIISNSDDVDDVIVRPISQTSMQSNQSDNSPKVQQPPTQAAAPRTQPAPVEPNKPNYQSSVLKNITAEQNTQPNLGRVSLARNENVPVPRQEPVKKTPEAPTPAARKPAEDTSRKQNGTNAKPTVNIRNLFLFP